MRLGLLSTARINEKLVAGARLVDEVELSAIASRDLARAEAQAAELGIERAHGSYEDLLADPDVDAVYISLPNSLHVEWSIRALEAGKHVLCEKPMARSVAQVERAFDAAESAGRVLAEAFMWRHHPQARRLAELVPRVGRAAAGARGLLVPARRRGRRAPVRLARGRRPDGRGLLLRERPRLIAGEPVQVSGEQVTGGDGVDVRFAATLRFGGRRARRTSTAAST